MAPSLGSWAITLENVGVGAVVAVGAELVALEVGERLLDLDEVATPEPTGASGALAGLCLRECGREDVEAVDTHP